MRSVCVASVAALGLILGREGQAIAALGAVVMGTLLIDPWASRSYGFALSALAALAVVGPAAAIVRSTKRRIRGDTRIGRILRRLTRWCACPPWPSSPPRHSSCPCRDPCLCGGSPPTSPPSLRCPWPRSRAWLEPSSRTSAPGSPNSAREWPPGRPGGSHPRTVLRGDARIGDTGARGSADHPLSIRVRGMRVGTVVRVAALGRAPDGRGLGSSRGPVTPAWFIGIARACVPSSVLAPRRTPLCKRWAQGGDTCHDSCPPMAKADADERPRWQT